MKKAIAVLSALGLSLVLMVASVLPASASSPYYVCRKGYQSVGSSNWNSLFPYRAQGYYCYNANQYFG